MDSIVASQSSPDAAGATRPLRILVVDDNPDSADMLALSLNLMGHEARALHDPMQAVSVALEFRPQLAFLDLGMPVLSGYALATQLRSQDWPGNRRLRLIALTGWGEAEDRRRSEAAGFDDHLVKPVDLNLIEAVCRKVAASLEADGLEA